MKIKCITCNTTFQSGSKEARKHIKHDWDFDPEVDINEI